MESDENKEASGFDKEPLLDALEQATPLIIDELADLFGKRAPRLTARDKREMREGMSHACDEATPHIIALQSLNGDLGGAYNHIESFAGVFLRDAKIRRRSGEDALDCVLRKHHRAVKGSAVLKRWKQYRVVHEGTERIIEAVLDGGGSAAAKELIKDFIDKQGREYVQFVNTWSARAPRDCHTLPQRMTPKVVAQLVEEYRSGAAAIEIRLRLLVGLNYIAQGSPKTYAELRKFDLNALLQTVESPKNPLLHCLRDAIDRHVRNALTHGSYRAAYSQSSIKFIDYSSRTDTEHEVVWTIKQFFRRTKNLTLTWLALNGLETQFDYYGFERIVLHLRAIRN